MFLGRDPRIREIWIETNINDLERVSTLPCVRPGRLVVVFKFEDGFVAFVYDAKPLPLVRKPEAEFTAHEGADRA